MKTLIKILCLSFIYANNEYIDKIVTLAGEYYYTGYTDIIEYYSLSDTIPLPSNKVDYFLSKGNKIELPNNIKETLSNELNNHKANFIKTLNYEEEMQNYQKTERKNHTYYVVDKVCVANWLRKVKNPSENDYYSAEASCQSLKSEPWDSTYNKFIEIGENIFENRPSWNDVINYYGGLSEMYNKKLNEVIISEDYHLNRGYFDLRAFIDKIEIISKEKCKATITYIGEDRQLDFHGISENSISIEGQYSIDSIINFKNKSLFEIYNFRDTSIIKFKIPGNNHKCCSNNMNYEFPAHLILYPDLRSKVNEFRRGIEYIVNNVIKDDIFFKIPSISSIIIKNQKIKKDNIHILEETILKRKTRLEEEFRLEEEARLERAKLEEKARLERAKLEEKARLERTELEEKAKLKEELRLAQLNYIRNEKINLVSLVRKNYTPISIPGFLAEGLFFKWISVNYNGKSLPNLTKKELNKELRNQSAVSKFSNLDIYGIQGFNFLLGMTSKRFYEPLKVSSWNHYWHFGTVFLYYPYIGIGSDYIFESGYFIGFKTYYIVPSITFGIYF